VAGLEHLKSVFGNIDTTRVETTTVLQDSYSHSELDDLVLPKNTSLTQMNSIFSNLNVVDFLDGSNSYGASFVPPIEGFTPNFNQGGYTFANGEVGNSLLLSQASNLSPDSNDLRFSAGFGFEGPHWTLQMATEGIQASLYYINSPYGDTIGVSGAFNQFGQLSETLSNIGINMPPIDFSAAIEPFGNGLLRYSDTVFESIKAGHLGIAEVGQIPTNDDANPPADSGGLLNYKNPYRGVAFQVLGPKNNPGMQGAVLDEDKYSHFIGNVELERVNSQLEGREFNESFVMPTPLPETAFAQPQIDFSYQDAVVNEGTLNFTSPLDVLSPGNIQLQIPPALQFLGNTFLNVFDEVSFRNLLDFRLDLFDLNSGFLKNAADNLEDAFRQLATNFIDSPIGIFGNTLMDRFKETMFGGMSSAQLIGQFSGQSPLQQVVSAGALAGTLAITRAAAPIIIGVTLLDTITGRNDSIQSGFENNSQGIFQGLSGFGNQVIIPAIDTVFGGAFDVVSDILSFTGQIFDAFSPIAGIDLPQLQLQNPINSVVTNYGGEGAVLNSTAPVRPTGAHTMKTGTGYMRLQNAPQPSMGQRDDPVQLVNFQYPNGDTDWMQRRLDTMGNLEVGFTGHMRPSSSRKLNEELSEESKRGEFPKWDPDVGSSKYSNQWSISNDGREVRTGNINGQPEELKTLKSSGPEFDPVVGSTKYQSDIQDKQTSNDVGVARLGSSTGQHSHNAGTEEETIPLYDKDIHPEAAASFDKGHVHYGNKSEFKDETKNKSILGSDPENIPTKGGNLKNTIPNKSILVNQDGSTVADNDRLIASNVQALNYSELIDGDGSTGGYNKKNKYGTRASSFYPDMYPIKDQGDAHTTAPILKGDKLKHATNDYGDRYGAGDTNYVEDPREGMPFYFKDLRDNSFIVFRAYLDGITDTIAPSWNPIKYVGRSEPTYVYDSAEREIQFNLHLTAQSAVELDTIYGKMRRLTSMCYPEYKVDTNLNNKVRMKPPLVKMRMGELFGNSQDELSGFLKSVSYTVPDQSTWEFRKGQRVPKLIDATIGYQVIHGAPPNKNTMFNGYIGTTGNEDLKTVTN